MKQLLFLFYFMLITATAFAQDSTFQQMLDFSRPGIKHAVLGRISGTWSFQDTKRSFVKGTLTRKSIYDGRFYIVEITGGRLQVPVANGKTKEDNYRQMLIEGYDNGRMKFVAISINNHIGSDIEMEMGNYDSIAKSFTYAGESELIPGMKQQYQRVLKIIDDNHYVEEYYEDHDGKAVKVRALAYSRIQEK
jgi:hypothetical protein